jgi:hypothetical protein
MSAITEKTESEEPKQLLYQEAEGLLNDVISKSEEHLGADSLRWVPRVTANHVSIPSLLSPLTSSMDIA